MVPAGFLRVTVHQQNRSSAEEKLSTLVGCHFVAAADLTVIMTGSRSELTEIYS